ncbi:MAG: hypothetical protein JNM17_33880 [Archangium sp.]|nr:hypothetical protein [Archangium sp.]
MRRLLVERARALALQEDGSEEEIAARIAADPIRRFTELEWPPLAVLTRRGLCLALASLVATELAFFVDQSLAACVAAIAVGAWLWFIAAHAAYLRGPIILTRTRLIVGRRAFAIAEMRKLVLHILHLPSLEILHQDASTTTFSRPPRWLLDELRSQGVPCERRWGVLSLD